MQSMRAFLCVLLTALIPGLSVVGETVPAEKVDRVRTGMTIGGALLGVGIAGATAFLIPPEGTALADRLVIAISVAGAAAATGAVAGRWMADTVLKLKPSLPFSPVVGAGLGMLGAGFVGGISFALTLAIAIPTIDAPPGYWGRDFTYPQAVGMGFLAGAFWGGITGIPVGAVTVPIISIYMGF